MRERESYIFQPCIYKSNNIKCIVFFVFDMFVRFIKVSNFRLFKILFFYPSFSF